MRRDARAGLLPLPRRLQQKLPHAPGAYGLHQVEKRAMFESTAAAAILFPARQVLLHERSAKESGWRLYAVGKFGLSLLERARGNFLERNRLNHISY